MNTLIKEVHQIYEALVIRGFSVRQLHDRLIFVEGAARYEWEDLKSVLKAAGVVFRANARSLTILHIIELEEAIEIIQFHSCHHRVHPQWYDWNWKSFTRRKFSRKSSALDHSPGIAYLVKSLGKAGIHTAITSDGRGKSRPYIDFAGLWNGIWLEYLFTYHMQLSDLHYKWSFKTNKSRTFTLTASFSSSKQQWDPSKIQEDAFALGLWLNNNAEKLRNMKQICFKYRSMKDEVMKLAQDYDALKQWMYEKISEANNKQGLAQQKLQCDRIQRLTVERSLSSL